MTLAAIGAYVNAGTTTDLGEPPRRQAQRGDRRADLPPLRRGQARFGRSRATRTKRRGGLVARRRDARRRGRRRRRSPARPRRGSRSFGTLRRETAAVRLRAGQARPARRRELAAQQAAQAKQQATGQGGGNQTGPPSLSGTQGLGKSPIPPGSLSQGLRRTAQLRVRRELPDEHRERLLRRLPVRPPDVARARRDRPAERRTARGPEPRPPTSSTSATAGTPGPPVRRCSASEREPRARGATARTCARGGTSGGER